MRDSRSFNALLPSLGDSYLPTLASSFRVASVAQLDNLGGAHLRPVAISVSDEFQCCVDAGAAAAACFLVADAEFIGLQDHSALAVRRFRTALERSIVAGTGSLGPARRRVVMPRLLACVTAFEAGYLGRIQQEKKGISNE